MSGPQQEANPAPTGATEQLRRLPSVDSLLQSSLAQRITMTFGRSLTLQAVRDVLDDVRQAVRAGDSSLPTEEEILNRAEQMLFSQIQPTLRPVINATGVIVHTNLGRAILSGESIAAVADVARSYSNLEYDLEGGGRGSRSVHAESLLKRLTGAEAAFTVNNNAAAVLLMLTALCQGRQVIISRGQLIEIGGGFRVPDVRAQSGAQLVEVGTTNRTHVRDYENAISDGTAAILVAHHSNFRILGFTTEPELSELSGLAREHGVLMLYDQGSGAVRDATEYGLAQEPTVQDALGAGVDVVAFSGDKLLGGPQAGILCGRDTLIQETKRHPLARAVRADKMCLAALSSTLRAHVAERAYAEIPVWKMISAEDEQLRSRAERWRDRLIGAGLSVEVRPGHSTVGGGSLPGSTLATWLTAIQYDNVEKLGAALRETERPVIGRIADDRLLLDPRTVLEEQEEIMLASIIESVSALEAESGSGVRNAS
ncbi:MAG: L-seryl-tRNA(Sec) selenium transferase [Chloroflexota bacterium]|nr:MAG: L-seryl-tRNA(Sec) selenium transferase [Chloroflexota bacterium]